MRIPRIYLSIDLTSDIEIELEDRARQHIVQVLRLKTGAALIVFDGHGSEYEARLIQAEKRKAIIQTGQKHTPNCESPLFIHLGLGISKGERMDYAIQKSVELGANEITPLFTDHCTVQLDQKRRQKRQDHWQGIIQSACEQCGRTILPVLNPAQNYEQWITLNTEGSLALILDPASSYSLNSIEVKPEKVHLLIGPEGGFSMKELKQAGQHAYHGLRLGPRVLRTETAVVAGLSALQTIWGDLNQN
ncbi:MAG: 16S rRNA (uracil(1498)-N(3))-methyltransferase [Gammaproteobacteria bacterium]|nr:16S rRNA (uracil(1498)-N(3))-methyltransferase [Gammaproteobacteria bacterium]